MRGCIHRTACAVGRQYTYTRVYIYIYAYHRNTHILPRTARGGTGRTRNVLEIGDLDNRVGVDFLIACCLSLDVTVELFEKDIIAQDFGATCACWVGDRMGHMDRIDMQ